MAEKRLVIYKSWRSEYIVFACLIVSLVLSVALSKIFPSTVITGELFKIGDETYYLSFPIFWIIPFGLFLMSILHIYDVRYYLTSKGIEMEIGILSLKKRSVKIRYEDVRSVETIQTLIDRIINIGNVEIGTSATGAIEVIFAGVASPVEIQQIVQREKDRRIAMQKASGSNFSSVDW